MKTKIFKGLCVGLFLFGIIGIQKTEAMSLTWDYGSGAWNLGYFGPMGQTFLATDSDIGSIGFSLEIFGPGHSTDLTFEVYAGAGQNGALMSSEVITGFSSPGWVDFDVSDLIFEGGEVYTAVLSSSRYWGFRAYQHTTLSGVCIGPDYYGGDMIRYGEINPYYDAVFRIKGVEPVPEPATILLFISGIAGLAGSSLKRKTK